MIWLKTMGVAMVIAGSGAFGMMGARGLDQRVEQLKQLRLAIAFLEKEITYMQTPLSMALTRTADFTAEPVKQLFLESSHILKDRQGVTIREAWQKGLKMLAQAGDLQKEDLNLLQTLAAQLGMSGTEEQKKMFQMVDAQLQIQEQKARETSSSNRKLWAYGGFIVGAAVVLLLL
ncbi:MAG: hypothetical protein U9N81_03025 [Bacillota bacterium]|nr:hypothetical protein [Bacillota bacterium]